MQVSEQHDGALHFAFTEENFNRAWFTDDALRREAKILQVGLSSGTACYSFDGRYVLEQQSWKQSFWRGHGRTQGWQVFELLSELYGAGLPVRRPLAIMAAKHGIGGVSHILVYQLADMESISSVLKTRSVPENIWQGLGALLRQLHDLQVSVNELTLEDFVLNSQGQLFLNRVKGVVGNSSKNTVWKQDELQSLLTSIVELRKASASLFFEDQDWLTVTQAYMTRAQSDFSNKG